MQIIADLHLHSKYSRATSKQMEVDVLDIWGRKKGIHLIGTGDFTHPAYFKELQKKLAPSDTGFFKVRDRSLGSARDDIVNGRDDIAPHFILSSEISCIYKDKEKTRRLHICLLAPDFKAVKKLQQELEKRGCNIRSDGRPIIGLKAKELLEICLEIDERILTIPAHAWTPWFAIFGSKSGYDSIEECYEDLTPHIYAIETGLSSDPEMNWRLSALDDLLLVSNGDAHSPKNIGREANVFDLEKFTYDEIFQIFKKRDKKKFLYTIEFYPEEGKYHWDGHQKCKFSCAPAESLKHKNICPICKKPLVLGVEHRVEALADRPVGFKPNNAVPFKSLVPLQEIISECLGRGKNTKGVQELYEKMLEKGESEFNILLDLKKEQISNIAENEMIGEAVQRVRDGKVYRKPGYDGEFGVITVFTEKELEKLRPTQKKLL